MSLKPKGMTLDVKRRTEVPAIPEEAVEAFAAGAETERQKADVPPAPRSTPPTSRKTPAQAGKSHISKGVVAPEQGRVIRDGYSMPDYDHALIAEIQGRCLRMGLPMGKGEVLRAGLRALAAMSDARLQAVAGAVEKIKPGRPKQTV